MSDSHAQIRWPDGVTEITYKFGPNIEVVLRGVYASWEVWDYRSARQGSKQIECFLSRRHAFDAARELVRTKASELCSWCGYKKGGERCRKKAHQ